MTILIVAPAIVILACQFSNTHSQSNFNFTKQLTVVSNDCYARTAIGSRLPASNTTGATSVENVSDCEDECTRRRDMCKVFSFGINMRGNASCMTSDRVPQSNELVKDVDYDVYMRMPTAAYCHSKKSHTSGHHIKLPHPPKKTENAPWYSKFEEPTYDKFTKPEEAAYMKFTKIEPEHTTYTKLEESSDFYFPRQEIDDFFKSFEKTYQERYSTDNGNGHQHSPVRKYDANNHNLEGGYSAPSNNRELVERDFPRQPKVVNQRSDLLIGNEFDYAMSEFDHESSSIIFLDPNILCQG